MNDDKTDSGRISVDEKRRKRAALSRDDHSCPLLAVRYTAS